MAVFSSAQVGKTEILNNLVGYHIDQDPAPILVVQPTLQMAEAWSKDRLAPMLRDTPTLRGKVKDPRARDSGNTLLHKTFPGGHITMAGANSPASLASRPVRLVVCDEVDRFPPSAGTEGDPVNLSKKRAANFWNRKIGMFSTGTVKGASRIELAYQGSDQRKFWVACPHCGHEQLLAWSQVQWTKTEDGRHLPATARYACSGCAVLWTDGERGIALKSGEWRAEAPFNGIAGFWLSALYSPWVTLESLVTDFLEAKKAMDQGDARLMVVFVNTALGETWEEGGEQPDWGWLAGRREEYTAEVPSGALLLVAGVDIQDNRFELEVIGYGLGEESWGIEYKVIHGDPTRASFWEDLDRALLSAYVHESDAKLHIAAAAVDSGGHHTQAVYDFCEKRAHRRVFAVKGVSGAGHPTLSATKRKGAHAGATVDLFNVGVDGAKGLVYSRLRVTEPGPGYCHFPKAYPEPYFEGLTVERLVTRYSRGVPQKVWVCPSGARNEPLDIRVYAAAALKLLSPNWESLTAPFTASTDGAPARRVRSRGIR